HDREFARLTGAEVGADRLSAARRAAADLGAVLLLKGHATVVARPDGTGYVDAASSNWLATAGSGDGLSGMIGGLAACGGEAALARARRPRAAQQGRHPGRRAREADRQRRASRGTRRLRRPAEAVVPVQQVVWPAHRRRRVDGQPRPRPTAPRVGYPPV